MTIDQLQDYLSSIPDEVMEDVPEIIAETATEYFKEAFTKKEFNSNPWAPLKKEKHTGSLLVESGDLVNSIHPAIISREKVVISAGNDKVTYAQPHNEGFTGPVVVKAHARTSKSGKQVDVPTHTINQNIPQRQFMGKTDELAEILHERIVGHLNSKL